MGRSDRGWEIAVEPIILTDIGRQLFSKNVLVSVYFAYGTFTDCYWTVPPSNAS
jgi:hypothetical protein